MYLYLFKFRLLNECWNPLKTFPIFLSLFNKFFRDEKFFCWKVWKGVERCWKWKSKITRKCDVSYFVQNGAVKLLLKHVEKWLVFNKKIKKSRSVRTILPNRLGQFYPTLIYIRNHIRNQIRNLISARWRARVKINLIFLRRLVLFFEGSERE